MSCNDKKKFITSEASSKASLRTKGAIDKFLNILDVNMFNKLNKTWSEDAVKRFSIVGKLFYNDDGKAVANKVAFKKIDNSKGIFYQINNSENTLIKPGVNDLFEQSPELANAVYESLGFKTNLPSIDNIIETDNKEENKKRLIKRRELAITEINAIEELIRTNPDEIIIYNTALYEYDPQQTKYFDKSNWNQSTDKYKTLKIITKPSYLHSHLDEELQHRIKNLQIINSSLFSDVESVNYSNIFQEGNSYSSVEVLKYISKNKKDVLSDIAKTLLKYSEKNNVEIQILEKNNNGNSIAGTYFGKNKIEIYSKKNVTSHTLIHEIVHSFSSLYIYNNAKSKFVLELNNILKNILDKKILKEYSNFENSYEDYATKNIHELLAEIISRPDILAHLALYNTDYNLIKDDFKKETLLDQIVKILSDIFNFTKKEADTLGDLILLNAVEIFENSKTTSDYKTSQITPQQKQQAQQQYSQYLDSVFPDSKVKDILYHGTDANFDKFDNDAERRTFVDKSFKVKEGTFLTNTNNKENVNHWGKNTIAVIVNVTNSIPVSFSDFERGIFPEKADLIYPTFDVTKPKTLSEVLSIQTNVAIKSSEQIHILGRKQDIEEFNKFVNTESKKQKEGNAVFYRTGISVDKNFPRQGEIIEYNGIEYMVHDSNRVGSQFLNQEALSEEPYGLQYDAIEVADQIPFYNLDPVGKGTVELGFDPIFDIPLTTLLKDGFTSTGKTFNYEKYKNTFGQGYKEQDLMFQKQPIPASKASQATLEKLKTVIEKLGINLTSLEKYLKSNPNVSSNINALADLTKGVIAIATGKESEAITEELVHIATAIVEQKNPQLITNLISKIDKFKIYKQVFSEYKDIYKTSDGKPDIRKIKKEAVDKLIAEMIINQAENIEQYPELLELENRNLVEQMWDAITTFIRQLYQGKQVDIFTPFEQLATDILNNNIDGSASDLQNTENGTFFQIDTNSPVEKAKEKFLYMHNNMQLTNIEATNTEEKQRFYTYLGKKLKYTVSTITGKKPLQEKDPAKLREYDIKKEFGSRGHLYIDQYIKNNLIDAQGYKLETPLEIAIGSELNSNVKEILENFSKELINSYKDGTVFLLENMVVNEKVSMGSAIDFIAIEPVTIDVFNNKGELIEQKEDVKVDFLDWKFSTQIDKSKDDIIISKQIDWKKQMGQYARVAYEMGFTRAQLRKTRMIPIISNYAYEIPKDKNSALNLNTIEIGKLNSINETTLHLLPVALSSESTGNTEIDKLLDSLNGYYQNLINKTVSSDKKFNKEQRLQELSGAIRKLHMKLSFEPLYNVAKSFLTDVKSTVNELKNLDFSQLTPIQINTELERLLEHKRSASKFIDLDKIYLNHVNKGDMTPENKKLIVDFERITKATNIALKEINAMQLEYAKFIQLQTNVQTNVDVEKAEREIDGMSKTFLEFSKLPPVLIQILGKMWLTAKNLIAQKFVQQADIYEKLLTSLEQEARSKGKTAFSMIGNVKEDKLQIFQKLDQKFLDKLQKARENSDRKTLLANVDLIKFNELTKKYKENAQLAIANTQYSTDEAINEEEKQRREKNFLKSIQLNNKEFNGFTNRNFIEFYNEALIEKGNFSAEYTEMLKSSNATAMWNWYNALNERAIASGYLQKGQNSFFPLIEATFIQKMSKGDVAAEAKDFFRDFYTADSNEDIGYSKKDAETGTLLDSIPKYFINSKKQTTQLSTDLNKVGLTWLKAIMEYESRKEMEYQMLTLADIEENKDSLLIDDKTNSVVLDNDGKLLTKNTNKNSDFLKKGIRNLLYGQSEDSDSMGNSIINFVVNSTEKGGTTEEKSISVKKGIKTAEQYIRNIGIGLKPLLGIANFSGGNFQAIINSGTHYKGREFLKYIANVLVYGKISLIEKALLDKYTPLAGEDPLVYKQRQLAKGQSYAARLNAWTFQDAFMITNSFGEKRIELANALAIINNSIVINGQIINIRQYLKKQDQLARKTLSETDRINLEKTFEKRVQELQNSDKALKNIAKIENDELIIPGVSDITNAYFRMSILDVSRNITGQMSNDDRMGFRGDTIFNSFMMFKGWIPKLFSTRLKNITQNTATEEWEYGRYKAFFGTWSSIGFKNIADLREIIIGTDKGLSIINDLLEEKKKQYFNKNGKELVITPEEFQDLIRSQITNMMKEIYILLGVAALVIGAKLVAPDDDEDDLTKNRYKYFAKAINKVSDEIYFFVNPLSADQVTRGSIFPALGILSKTSNIIKSVVFEGYYSATGQEDKTDKNYVIKPIVTAIPLSSQIFTELMPNLFPEEYKELGGRVTIETKR